MNSGWMEPCILITYNGIQTLKFARAIRWIFFVHQLTAGFHVAITVNSAATFALVNAAFKTRRFITENRIACVVCGTWVFLWMKNELKIIACYCFYHKYIKCRTQSMSLTYSDALVKFPSEALRSSLARNGDTPDRLFLYAIISSMSLSGVSAIIMMKNTIIRLQSIRFIGFKKILTLTVDGQQKIRCDWCMAEVFSWFLLARTEWQMRCQWQQLARCSHRQTWR